MPTPWIRPHVLPAALIVVALVAAGCTDPGTQSGDTSPAPTTVTASISTTQPATTTSADGPATLAGRLQRILDSDAGALLTSSPGQIMHIIAPHASIDDSVASGSIDFNGPALVGNETVRIASVTKAFVAAAVLRLVEQARLTLDQTLPNTALPTPILELLARDGYRTDSITIEQLLRHTSGIADFAGNAAGIGASAYSQAVLSDPTHQWTALEQITFAAEHADPLAAPGDEFHYSDTNYVLLGQIIEATTHSTLAESLRQLLRFDQLGLTATYLETVEPVPFSAGPRAVQYIGDQRLNELPASIDLFGGGGLVSSMRDVATFFHDLFNGRVFDDPATIRTMTSLDERTGATAGLGLFHAVLGAVDCWYHDGLWGVLALVCPDIDLTITRTWNQAIPDNAYDPNTAVLQALQALSDFAAQTG